MKTIRFLLGLCFVLGALAGKTAAAQTVTVSAPDSELQALREQVHALQAQVRTLEERLKKLEAARSARLWPRIEIRPADPIPPSGPGWRILPEWFGATGTAPKIWGQREVNGWTAYYVPCRESR